MISNEPFWDKTWSRTYVRYNRHHQEIWEYLSDLGLKGKIADLGCGPCVMWKDKDVDLIGVDWSAEALKQAKLNYPKGVYVQAQAHATGLPSGQFDSVIACGLLDLIENWNPVIMEAERLLKGGGIFYATLLNGFSGHDWSKYPKICGNWHLMILKEENDTIKKT